MKLFVFSLLILVYGVNLFSQDCGTFHLFNFKDTIVDDWVWNEPRNGFYFDMTYDELTADNTGYISFALVDINGDTITNTDYYRWSRFFPFRVGDTTRYAMVLNDSLSKFPKNFVGFLVTHNPVCKIPVSTITTKVLEISNEYELDIFPNPCDEYLNLLSDEAILRIEIFDLNGLMLLSKDYQKRINLDNLSNGVYITKITYFDSSYKFKKFIKR
ncbi:MAG: T9SS type A sorting domain-containing protein [Chlorobiota bacterium]